MGILRSAFCLLIYRVRTHDSNSTDRPRPVKIILGSVEEKRLLLNQRKMFHLVMPDYYFSLELQQGRTAEEELQFSKGQVEEDLVIKNGAKTV